MHKSMHRVQRGDMTYYICDKLADVRHAFTTKSGGVSRGDCESLNLGFNRGDETEKVLQNYRILASTLAVPYDRITVTQQVHRDEVSIVNEEAAGMGLRSETTWQSDAIITRLADTPLIGYYADCVVTLLYDPATRTCGVCHSGWRGTAMDILGKTVDKMVGALGTKRESLIAVLGPSICGSCFETDADVPEAMEAEMGTLVRPYIKQKGAKYHIDLRQVNAMLLKRAGLAQDHVIDSGICTRCECAEFWSHRATNGKRGVQGAIICL